MYYYAFCAGLALQKEQCCGDLIYFFLFIIYYLFKEENLFFCLLLHRVFSVVIWYRWLCILAVRTVEFMYFCVTNCAMMVDLCKEISLTVEQLTANICSLILSHIEYNLLINKQFHAVECVLVTYRHSGRRNDGAVMLV